MTDNTTANVTISDSAQTYLKELLSKQEVEGIGIRMFVSNPGTPRAETCIAYCRPGESEEGDEVMELNGFNAYFEARSVPFLEDASVDYSPDRMGGQLTIRAPNSKMVRVTDDSPVEDKINYVLHNDVNPGLAAHGGQVSLVEFGQDGIAVLEFGGGCQGCSAIDITVRDGVEKTLMDQVAEVKGVRDVTDHSQSDNAYYK